MNIKDYVLFAMCCLFFIFCYPVNSIATTTTSNVGIVFTEKEVSEEGGNPEKESRHSVETGKQVDEFPQTGEKEQIFLALIGVMLFIIAIWLRKRGVQRMKLKRIMLASFVGSVVLGATIAVQAAPQDEILGSKDGLGGTSHGYIKLTPGDVTVGPVAPIKPTTPKGDTGNVGSLTIDNVAPLLFDTHKLEGKEQVYTSSVVGSNMQVTDNRGEEAGWSVQVSQTQFKDVVDPLKILKGAKLTLPVGTIETAGTNVSLQPTVFAIEVNETPATLMNAVKGSGAGTWVNTFAEKDLKLTVPAGNRNGEYLSTVTWSLTDAPK